MLIGLMIALLLFFVVVIHSIIKLDELERAVLALGKEITNMAGTFKEEFERLKTEVAENTVSIRKGIDEIQRLTEEIRNATDPAEVAALADQLDTVSKELDAAVPAAPPAPPTP